MEGLSQKDYDDLINFALDLNDKVWFKELCEKQKKYNEIENSKEYDFPIYMTALTKLKNNDIYILSSKKDTIIGYPETKEEIENGRVVKVQSLIDKEIITEGSSFRIYFLKENEEKIAKTILKQTIKMQNKLDNLTQEYKKLEEINELNNNTVKSQEKMIEDYKKIKNKKWWKFWKRR